MRAGLEEKGDTFPSDDLSVAQENNIKGEINGRQQIRILLATSLQAFIVIGLTQSYGIFQAHYGSKAAVEDGIVRPSDIMQRALVAAMGSFGNGGVVAAFSIFYYPCLPSVGKHIKTVCIVGTLLMTIGFGIATASTHLWQLVITQGLLVGIGGGMMLYTLTPVLPEYFVKHSGLAQGVMLAVAGVGGMIFSLMIPMLLETLGSRKTLGTLAITILAFGSMVSILALPPRKLKKRSQKVVGWKTFKDPMFVLLFLANLIHPLTLAIPITFGPEFGEALGFHMKQASYMLALTSGVGIPSRLCVGCLADYLGHQNTLLFATALYATSTWAFWLVAAQRSDTGLWTTFLVFYGLVNGCFNTVMNSAQRELFGDELYFPFNGAMTSIRGVGYVVGVPCAGALVSRLEDAALHGHDFKNPILYTGVFQTVSLMCLIGVRWLDATKNGKRLIR